MAQSEAFERAIGIAIEDTWGVAPASPQIAWFAADGQLRTEYEEEDVEPALGVWDQLHVVRHRERVTGTLRLEVAPGREDAIVKLLQRRTGSKRYLNSATIWENFDEENNLAFQSVGVCVNTATLRCDGAGRLIAELDCLGKQRQLVTFQAMSVAQIPEPAYIFEEMLVTFNGTDVLSVQAMEVRIEHRLRDDRYGADRTGLLRHLPSQGRTVRVRIPREFEDGTFHDAWANKTEGTLVIDFRRTLADGEHYFTMTMNRVRVVSCDPEDEDQPIELAALAPSPGAEAIQFDWGVATAG